MIAPRTKITLDSRLAYRNKEDPDGAWKPYASSIIERILDCSIDDVKKLMFFLNKSTIYGLSINIVLFVGNGTI